MVPCWLCGLLHGLLRHCTLLQVCTLCNMLSFSGLGQEEGFTN